MDWANFSMFIDHHLYLSLENLFFASAKSVITPSFKRSWSNDFPYFSSIFLLVAVPYNEFDFRKYVCRNKNESKSQCQTFPFFLFFAVIRCRVSRSFFLARQSHCGCIKFIGFESNSSCGFAIAAAIASLQIIVISFVLGIKKLYCSLSLWWCPIIKLDDVNTLLIK